ncbi:ligase-associated DNA damage response endonuclease PdeM [Croceicoccus ponticola]|uniref:Ligase-associated DNA damage response endonuclease PdeM n=1 Tax=Croceicoccus ponticola TaxID=2217664 RepID=A0A437GUT6_9SPHN|nr:ligase-associated DNA damage response endonuclease PdeM [Croceicoccus ponticola]RVQ65302.1 ligase-associated DNA damage response endonuclease PdeM [Croceicoccus ponticola]
MVPVSFAPFSFAGEEWHLVDGRALFWPRERALLVADLHLEKASWYAKCGQPLPPYDSRETLQRIADAIKATDARRVFTLGDNFHDGEGPDRLEPHASGMLDALTRAVDWVWITGNHDEKHGLRRAPGGTQVAELATSGLLLRHQTLPGETRPEMSGHFHPRLQVRLRGRRIVRPCAVASVNKLILPAFGALTAGMDAADPAIRAALRPARSADAIVPAAGRLLRFPLWSAAA